VADAESVEVRFPRLAGLVADLRAMAGTSLLPGGVRRPLGRIAAAVAGARFEGDAGESGKTSELFEIVHLSGWAPSPDQPKPPRRGSGSASLAAALRDRAG
jgi:NADH dehydrogenase [ubiquinone] 1 alpha subcomplex assembly factor 5